MTHRLAKYVTVGLAAVALAACGSEKKPEVVATVVSPSKTAARIRPGGRVVLEGACTDAAQPASHAWDISGGVPSTSAVMNPGVVAFPNAGTFAVTYRCTGADGNGSAPARLTITVSDPGPSLLRIEPQYLSTQAAQDLGPAFDAAVAILTTVVVGPAPGFDAVEPPWDACGTVTIATHAGALRVLVDEVSLDNKVGGIVAVSSPCYVRTADGLPYAGFVWMDTMDVASLSSQGKLVTTLLHELMHVLGFGTLWADQPGLPTLMGGHGTADPFFAGVNARAAYEWFEGGDSLPGTPVPLENTGTLGGGSRERHWRATVFGTELMTSVLGATSPLGRSTIEAFADQGWVVDPEQASSTFGVQAGLRLLQVAPAGGDVDLSEDVAPIVPRYR